MNIKRKIEKVLDLVGCYLEDNYNMETFRKRIIPSLLELYSYFGTGNEQESKLVNVIKRYWIEGDAKKEELQQERDKFYERKTINTGKFFALQFLAIPFEDIDNQSDGNLLGFFTDGLLNSGMPKEYLFDKLVSEFKDIVNVENIDGAIFSDNNQYVLMDYSPYNSKTTESRKMLFRSYKTKERDYNIDIFVEGISVLVIPTTIKGIELNILDLEENLIEIEELREQYGFNKVLNIYTLKTEGRTYYFDASCIKVYHNKLDIYKSSLNNYGKAELILYHNEVQLWKFL